MKDILGLIILGIVIISTFWCYPAAAPDSRAGAVI